MRWQLAASLVSPCWGIWCVSGQCAEWSRFSRSWSGNLKNYKSLWSGMRRHLANFLHCHVQGFDAVQTNMQNYLDLVPVGQESSKKEKVPWSRIRRHLANFLASLGSGIWCGLDQCREWPIFGSSWPQIIINEKVPTKRNAASAGSFLGITLLRNLMRFRPMCRMI